MQGAGQLRGGFCQMGYKEITCFTHSINVYVYSWYNIRVQRSSARIWATLCLTKDRPEKA